MFNSLKYAKILENAGLPRNQAETDIQILSDVIGEEMAIKEDIGILKSETAYELQSLEYRIILKLGGFMAACLATGLTAAKLLFM